MEGFDRLAFSLRGRRVALDLTATLGSRHGRTPLERLRAPDDLGRWLEAVGLCDQDVRVSGAQLAAARRLRETIRVLAEARIARGALSAAAVECVNAWAARPVAAPQLEAAGGHVVVHADDPVDAALAAIARDAVQLIGGPEHDRLKECASPDCALLFVDGSQGKRRRWCSMDACGNRAKTRSYRKRRQKVRP
jgi:predicted RNA-binding Zn ribbon-like protein